MKTPTYRNDPDAGLDPALETRLDAEYFSKLPHKKTRNPKVLVVFSGGNAVGKSTISRAIANELHGLVLENDAMKVTIRELLPGLDRDEYNKLTWQYSMSLYRRISQLSDNGLIVRDGVIDWYYDRIIPIFEQQGFRLFIVGFDVSLKKQAELIVARGDTATVAAEKLLELQNEHATHISRFRNNYTPDILITDETLFQTEEVISKLAIRIKQFGDE